MAVKLITTESGSFTNTDGILVTYAATESGPNTAGTNATKLGIGSKAGDINTQTWTFSEYVQDFTYNYSLLTNTTGNNGSVGGGEALSFEIDGVLITDLQAAIDAGLVTWTPTTPSQYIDGAMIKETYNTPTGFDNGTLVFSGPFKSITIIDTSVSGDGNGVTHNMNVSTTAAAAPAPCFTTGTMIETSNGQVAVENLKVGDKVRTKGNGMQVVRWIGRTAITPKAEAINPKLKPVQITAGSLGRGLPANDLIVSQQHRMLVSSSIAKRMFGETEVLIAAKELTALPGIFVKESTECYSYFHIAFDNHEVVFAEGAATESLYLGPNALEALPEALAEEIFTLFPHINESIVPVDSARFIPIMKQQKKLIARHIKNNSPVLQLD